MQENNDCNGCGQPLQSGAGQINLINGSSVKAGACQGCSGNKFSGKLGSCQQCMYMASFGMVFGWSAYLIVFLLGKEKNIQIAILGIASLFTLLLIAHGIAFLVKKSQKKNEN